MDEYTNTPIAAPESMGLAHIMTTTNLTMTTHNQLEHMVMVQYGTHRDNAEPLVVLQPRANATARLESQLTHTESATVIGRTEITLPLPAGETQQRLLTPVIGSTVCESLEDHTRCMETLEYNHGNSIRPPQTTATTTSNG